VAVLDVVDVDLAHGVDTIEELSFTRQVPLESGQPIERRTLEVVATAPVRTTCAATAVGGLASIALTPLLGERSSQRRVRFLALTAQEVDTVTPGIETHGHKGLFRGRATLVLSRY